MKVRSATSFEAKNESFTQQSTAQQAHRGRQDRRENTLVLSICMCNQRQYVYCRSLAQSPYLELTWQCLIPYCLGFVRQENCASVCVLLSCRGPGCACARSSSQQGTATAQAARPREPKLTRGWGASRRSSQ